MLPLTLIRIVMTIAAIVLVYRFASTDRAGKSSPGLWAEALLANLVLFSVLTHTGLFMYPKPWVLIHEHDIFHYYLGSKYSREVGYSHLYQCAAVADAENRGFEGPRYTVRRMDDYKFIKSEILLQRQDEYRNRFTPERWEEFKGDVAVFHAGLEDETRWRTVLHDNGYNATPVWNMVARWITNRISVQWPPGLLILALFDTALLALMFYAVARSFDRRTALLGVVFLGTLAMMADGTIRGAFLRLDWLAMLGLATCALKRKHYKTAGALVAYATMVRIFPVVFVFGLGAKACWDFFATRRFSRRYVEFFVVFTLLVAALFTLSVMLDGGTQSWEEFWTKIRFHDTRMSPLRVGFKTLVLASVSPFMDRWPGTSFHRAARADELQGLWWSLQALVLISAFFAVRRLEDYETLPFCWILVYFLAAPTFYYQVVLLVLSLLFLPKLGQRARAHGLALLLGISIVSYVLLIVQNLGSDAAGLPWRRFSYANSIRLSGMLLLAALYVLGLSLYLSLTRSPQPSSVVAAASGSAGRPPDPPTAPG